MENNPEFNSFSLIKYVWRWRKLFLILCGTAGILSIFFSTKTFIKPQYTATAIIYAPRTNSVSKIFASENNINERLDIKAYAIEEETEQMMQILNSRVIKDVLIEKYDLINYYGINTNRKAWKAKLYETLENFVKVKRTQYGAISISVTDWNPERAAIIANDITSELDTIKNRIERLRSQAACKALEIMIQEAEKKREQVEVELDELSKNGVIVLDYQVERIMQQYAIALAQGNSAGLQRLQKEIDKMEKYGHRANALRREQFYLSDQIAQIKIQLLNAQMDSYCTMPVKFVLQNAVAPDKKSHPKKIMIGIIATLGVFFLTLIILLLIDRIREEIDFDSKPTHTETKE